MSDRDIPDHSPVAAGHPYDRHYFDTALGPVPYDRRYSQWMEFFGTIADQVVAGIKPKRVLDVGCAKGFLVEALRDRGVEAFGIDISEYAIGEVRPDIRPYCRVASATEPFDEHYDLIICIEVLEHLREHEGRRAIANICGNAGDVLFSSTPDDVTERTHVNVRPRSWWIERFADHGFHLDLDFDAGFISAQAMRLRAGGAGGSLLDPLLAQRYQLLRQLAAFRGEIGGLQAEIAQLSGRRDRLQSDLVAVQRGAEALRHELTARRLEVTALRQEGEQLLQTIGARDDLIAGLQRSAADKDDLIAGLQRSTADKDDLIAGLQRNSVDKDNLIAGLQRNSVDLIAGLQRSTADKDAFIAGLQRSTADKDDLIAGLQRSTADKDAFIAGLQRNGADKDDLITGLNYHLLSAQRTLGWKLLERLRRVRDRVLPGDSRRRIVYRRIRDLLEVLLDEEPDALLPKTEERMSPEGLGQQVLVKTSTLRPAPEDPGLRYQAWLLRRRLGRRDVARMKTAVKGFAYRPVISVVTPVYDTDEVWLRKAIESVRAQIYPHWELCLVNDGSTRPHVRSILNEYAAAEPRVKVEHLARNQGIVGASNRGLRLATGDFLALLDHDDELPPEALLEIAKRLNEERGLDLIYTDEDKLTPDGRRVEPFFKPDWSPDLLLSMNYITHLSVFRRSLLQEIGGLRVGLDGSQDYDLLLRFSERTQRIAHIPKILYHWRMAPGSAAASTTAKPYAYAAARRAIEAAVSRRGYKAQVSNVLPGLYSVRYEVRGTPLVSIIIPASDRWALLRECLQSIAEKTRYPHYEIIVLDNETTAIETRTGLTGITDKWRVHSFPGPFNVSALGNFGAAEARGDYFVFLDSDIQVIEPDWLTAMLEQAQRPDVGAVGARLHDPDGSIQHAGLVLGVAGVAGHAFKGLPGHSSTYFAFNSVVRNVSAVTAACMMVPRAAFEDVKGFDERLQVALNDVDFCLRLRQRDYLIVYAPRALLCHHESATRGRVQLGQDEELMWAIWGDMIRKGDPYYNPNLTLTLNDWSLAD